jgi:hypothetical protein
MSDSKPESESDNKTRFVSTYYLEARNYMFSRVVNSSIGGGLIGSSSGYYMGNMAARLGLSWAVAGGCLGFQFFGGVLALKTLRKEDDLRNYAISGSFASLSLGKYLELVGSVPKHSLTKNLQIMFFGSLFGIVYDLSESWVYGNCREGWLQTRAQLKFESAHREFVRPKSRPLSRELMGYVPPLQEGMSYEEEEQNKLGVEGDVDHNYSKSREVK